jgi:two-component system response regulator HydG
VVLSTLDDALIGSELFGHTAGAFTDARRERQGQFVAGHGGTVFLDEIGKTSLAVQQRLLHVVEYGELRALGSDRVITVDVRLIVATNLCLADATASGTFLPDLHARLSAFRVRLPPLRDRRADIPMLVQQSIDAHTRRMGCARPTVSPQLMSALQRANWPNNLRQLNAALHRILVDADGASELTLAHCEDESLDLNRDVDSAQPLTEEQISAAIASEGSISAAARRLRVDRSTIHRHLRRAAQAAPMFADILHGRAD